MMEAVTFIGLFIGVWLTIINATRTVHKQDVPFWSFVLQAFGIAGFVYLQWLH